MNGLHGAPRLVAIEQRQQLRAAVAAADADQRRRSTDRATPRRIAAARIAGEPAT